MNAAIRQAMHPDPGRRHVDVAAFVEALTHPPNVARDTGMRPPIERSPVAVWQGVSFVLFVAVIALGCYVGLLLG